MNVASWVPGAAGSPFPVEHLPYGVFSTADESPRVGVAIGSYVLDLAPLAHAERVDFASVFDSPSLNRFMSLGSGHWNAVRRWITERLTDVNFRSLVGPELAPMDQVVLHMPFEVADFVDFYASAYHAANIGRVFRPNDPPLLPNYKHLPIGYHGRAGTVAASGTPVIRPCGQRLPSPSSVEPIFGPSVKLDIEAEVGFVVGTSTSPGSSVPVDAFAEHVFGVVLVNDWTARDIQAWEYRPLGPFLGKSFLTSIASWVTPLAALSHAQIPLPAQDPSPLPYLRGSKEFGFDLSLSIHINDVMVSSPTYSSMYWSPAQMLAHLTVNGATLRTGDLFASGTVSGAEPSTYGSLMELSWNGTSPLVLGSGEKRSFLEDGDRVTISATAPGPEGSRFELAPVSAEILPAMTSQ